jgi:hypothetical protein
MKKSTYPLALVVAAILTIASCTKGGQLNAPAGQIAATKTILKINEPDLLALVGADSTKSVFWTVTPAGHDTLTTQKNGARLVFTKSGDYAVTANQSGAAPASITIKVTDSVYDPNYNPYFTPLTGDEIKLRFYGHHNKHLLYKQHAFIGLFAVSEQVFTQLCGRYALGCMRRWQQYVKSVF